MSGNFSFLHSLERMHREVATISAFSPAFSHIHTHTPFYCNGGMLKSTRTSEDSSSLCSIIHHLWLQNSPGSPWGYTLYPDGKTPVPLRACLLPGPSIASTGVYNQSLHFHAHIRAIKYKSKADWCKPFVNLMFAGAF